MARTSVRGFIVPFHLSYRDKSPSRFGASAKGRPPVRAFWSIASGYVPPYRPAAPRPFPLFLRVAVSPTLSLPPSASVDSARNIARPSVFPSPPPVLPVSFIEARSSIGIVDADPVPGRYAIPRARTHNRRHPVINSPYRPINLAACGLSATLSGSRVRTGCFYLAGTQP